MQNNTFTVLTAAGPSAMEYVRLHDMLTALAYHEPAVGRVIVIDDTIGPRDFSSAIPPMPATCQVDIIKSPREGRGEALNGGLTVSILGGILAASRGGVGDFLLRIDTDALIIAPFADQIRQVIAREPLAGIIGACTVSPTGKKRGDDYHRRIFTNAASWWVPPKDRKVVGRHRSFPTRWKHMKLLRLTRRARRAGCTLGENTMGGSYVITAEAVRRMRSAGLLRDIKAWIDTFAIEDGVIPLYARMTGLKLIDFAEPGQVFGIAYRGLPFPPEELIERRYSIIHSVKNDPRLTEEQIRAFFVTHRSGERAESTTAAAEA